MTSFLENTSLQLKMDTTQARWSLTSRQLHGPSILEAQTNALYRIGRNQYRSLTHWPGASISKNETIASPHGPLQSIRLQTDPDRNGLRYTLTFALPETEALLLWKIRVDHQGERPILLERLELLSAGFIYPSRPGPRGRILLSDQSAKPGVDLPDTRREAISKIRPMTLPGDYAFFSNGWQSWSNTRVYTPHDRFKRTRLGPLRAPIIANPDTPKPGKAGTFASDMFGVLGDRSQRSAILLGFLSQKVHFGSLETWIGSGLPAVRLWANGDGARLDPGDQIETDWAGALFLHLDTHDPIGPYLDAVAREHGLFPDKDSSVNAPTGWCSWYHYFREVTAEDIRVNLEAAVEIESDLPLKVIQIDDGYEAQVGDWLASDQTFPHGVAPLAAEIRQAGFSPGLWLAPFLVNPNSKQARDHPDWLLRGRLGLPVNAGHLWSKFHTALDLTHPEVLDYVTDLIKTVVEDWDFPYLKLDFLYAGALPGRHRDPTKTRAQVLRAGLACIREAAGEGVFLLGCGCPLGPAIGLVDAMRIGADVAHHWYPVYRGMMKFFKNEPDLPSARNAIHNSITRSALHQRWWINDPDCLLLGSEQWSKKKTSLSLAETQTLATVIALTGGSLLLSDPLPDLSPEGMHLAKWLIPLIGRRAHVLDWFDRPTPSRLQVDLENATGPWHLLAAFNWQDVPKGVTLHWEDFYLDPQEDYYARDFWSGSTYVLPGGQNASSSLTIPAVPAHGVVLLSVRQHRPYHPEYLGGNLHISQGLEVTAWEWKTGSPNRTGELRFQLTRPGSVQGEIELYLPRSPNKAHLNGNAISWESSGERRYMFPVSFEQTAGLEIAF